jgi:IS30 family transposase
MTVTHPQAGSKTKPGVGKPNFTTITQQEIDTAMERLNSRPRKRLGYQTPNQVFFKSGVALQI